MSKKIAVYLGEDNRTAPLQEKGRIVVYKKELGQWETDREVEFNWSIGSGGLKEMRRRVERMVESLGDCQVFVGQSIIGMPYHVLEKANFSIWESEGDPLNFLDEVLNREEEAELEKAEEGIPAPLDLGNGYYSISLTEVQQKNSSFTSKQVLLPFLKEGKFYSLEIICSHVPKWLEAEILAGRFTSRVEPINPREMKITLEKKVCQ